MESLHPFLYRSIMKGCTGLQLEIDKNVYVIIQYVHKSIICFVKQEDIYKKIQEKEEERYGEEIFIFDIDGTLTNRATGGIVPSAKEALQRLEENGHLWQSQLEEHIIRQKSLQRQMVLKIWSAMEEMDW